MIFTRAFILTTNTRLLVGVEIYPTVEIKIYLENKNFVKIDFSRTNLDELIAINLDHGLNKIGSFQTPISISKQHIADKHGFKIQQGDFHIFMVIDTMLALRDIIPIAKEHIELLKKEIENVTKITEDLVAKINITDTFDTARTIIRNDANSAIEKEMLLKIKSLLKLVKEKNEAERKRKLDGTEENEEIDLE